MNKLLFVILISSMFLIHSATETTPISSVAPTGILSRNTYCGIMEGNSEYLTNGDFETDPVGVLDPWSELSDWDFLEHNGGTAEIKTGKYLYMINSDPVNDYGFYAQTFAFTYDEESNYTLSGDFRLNVTDSGAWSQATDQYYFFQDSGHNNLGYIQHVMIEYYDGYSNTSSACIFNLSPWPINDPAWGDTGWVSWNNSLLACFDTMADFDSAGERANIVYVKVWIYLYTNYDTVTQGWWDNISFCKEVIPPIGPVIIDWFETNIIIHPDTPIAFYSTVNDNDSSYDALTVILYYSNDTFDNYNVSESMLYDETISENIYRFICLLESESSSTCYQYYYTANDSQTFTRSPEGVSFYNVRWFLGEEYTPPPNPDEDIQAFLGDQFKKFIAMAPWLIIMAIIIGILIYAKKQKWF